MVTATLIMADERAGDVEELNGLMAEMVQLLENEKYEAFVGKFLPPGTTFEAEWVHRKESVLSGMDENAPIMIRILKKASQQQPTFYANGQVAVYPLEAPLNSFHRIAWVKHRGLWFLLDKAADQEDISYLGAPE